MTRRSHWQLIFKLVPASSQAVSATVTVALAVLPVAAAAQLSAQTVLSVQIFTVHTQSLLSALFEASYYSGRSVLDKEAVLGVSPLPGPVACPDCPVQ